VYAVDAQAFETWGFERPIVPEPIVDELLPLHDPEDLTRADATWASVEPGSAVLIVGYAREEPLNWPVRLFASVGRALADEEAVEALNLLKAAGDEEGDLPYDAEAEFLMEGQVAFEMGGSGVFDEHGRQVGVLVRSSFADIGVEYLRAVRMTYLVTQIEAAFDALPDEDRGRVAPYLEQPR